MADYSNWNLKITNKNILKINITKFLKDNILHTSYVIIGSPIKNFVNGRSRCYFDLKITLQRLADIKRNAERALMPMPFLRVLG